MLARSVTRRAKESAMRRKKPKAYWNRLKELQKCATLSRDELLLAIGAAKGKAGRNAQRLVIPHFPGPGESVSTDTFRFEFDRKKLKATRCYEGQYLLRRNLKGDLGLRPIFHQLDERIETHIFISFLAYCLHVTLEQSNTKAATGLSSRSVLERLSEIQMLDVSIPITDRREIQMSRYTKPGKVHHLLLDQLGFTFPSQPPPEIRKPWRVVETF